MNRVQLLTEHLADRATKAELSARRAWAVLWVTTALALVAGLGIGALVTVAVLPEPQDCGEVTP